VCALNFSTKLVRTIFHSKKNSAGYYHKRTYVFCKVPVSHLGLQLTLNLLTTTIVAPPSNASKWQMGFNSAFKGLNLNFLGRFSKNSQISNSMKILPVGSELFHADRSLVYVGPVCTGTYLCRPSMYGNIFMSAQYVRKHIYVGPVCTGTYLCRSSMNGNIFMSAQYGREHIYVGPVCT
jgi:hypothetical protein